MLPPAVAEEDLKHLKWLSLAHYVYAAMMALWSVFGLFFLTMGLSLSNLPRSGPNPPPPMFGFIFAAMGAFFTLIFLRGRRSDFLRRPQHCAAQEPHLLPHHGWSRLHVVSLRAVLGALTFAVLFR